MVLFIWTINNSESVTYLSIYGNGAGTRCGAFHIKTKKNQDDFPKMHGWPLRKKYLMEIGSVSFSVLSDSTAVASIPWVSSCYARS